VKQAAAAIHRGGHGAIIPEPLQLGDDPRGHGGHVLELGRSNVFRAVGSLLERLGISATPPGGATP